MSLVKRLLTWLLTIATALALAYALFGAGFVVCTTPQATKTIGETFAGWEDATFDEQSMAAIAEAIRAFSFDGASKDDLFAAIAEALATSYPELAEVLDSASLAEALEGASDSDTTIDSNMLRALGFSSSSAESLEETYSLSQNALDHLEDCIPIFTTGRISTGVVGAFGVVGLVALWLLASRKRAGAACLMASTLVVIFIAGLGLWAILDFNGLFTWMHSLFFAQGTWTFSSQSLLIQLFPQAFWAAMAALWVISSLIAAGALALIGKLLRL